MNVLLTSAGRRTSLLRLFRSAAEQDGQVWAGDADPLAPTLQAADRSVVLPSIQDPSYLPTLLDHVDAHDVDLVVPLIDPDLLSLAAARSRFDDAGCELLTSDPSLLDLAHDKWSTVQHFSERGFRTPTSWLPGTSLPDEWPDPVFVKPRRGSASANARRVDRDGAGRVAASMESPLLQEVIDAPEVTVDALFDLSGRLLHYVPRLRLRTMAGESIQGRTLSDADLDAWLHRLLREIGKLGARGPITVQAFRTEPSPTLSEINPRFGGGFPLTHAAGGRYPEWILRMCAGASLTPRLGEYTDGLCMTRAYTEWFVEASSLDERD
jgi:carbamoyl-phosphate synthase large subunit